GPGEAHRHAGLRPSEELFTREQALAQQRLDVPGFDRDLLVGVLDDLHGRLADDLLDLVLERAQAGFAGVAVDQLAQRRATDGDLPLPEVERTQRLGQQEAPRDLELLFQQVAAQRDDLHAVEQRRR